MGLVCAEVRLLRKETKKNHSNILLMIGLKGDFMGRLLVEGHIGGYALLDLHLLVDVLLLCPLLPHGGHREVGRLLGEVVIVLMLEENVLLDILVWGDSA